MSAAEPQIGSGCVAAEPSSAAIWRKRWGVHTPASLQLRAQEWGSADHLVEGLLPSRSIGLMVGDSGLGKSPLACQLGICVATGLPFLGRKTRKGRVVIADFENGIADLFELIERICRYLGLPGPPSDDDLLIWTLNDCLPEYGHKDNTLLDMLREVRPTLTIVDSLAAYDPQAEERNSDANRMLRGFREVARKSGTAFLGVHHRRKMPRKADESAGPLEGAKLRQWFQDTRGASALINGSDVRLGVDEPDTSAVQKDDVALVLRGLGRIRGEIGPFFLARDHDENGDPAGYRQLTGPELLFNDEQQKALTALHPQFTFKEAKAAYGRSDQPTRNWLVRSSELGLVRQQGRGSYEKIVADGVASDRAHGERR
jgi:AAA domain